MSCLSHAPLLLRPHYGAEFRVELVDASTNDPLGAGVITTQSLLLRQRDAFVEKHGLPILFPFRRPPSYDAQPILLELLAGVKSGADYFSVTKATSNATGNKAKGESLSLCPSGYRRRIKTHGSVGFVR